MPMFVHEKFHRIVHTVLAFAHCQVSTSSPVLLAQCGGPAENLRQTESGVAGAFQACVLNHAKVTFGSHEPVFLPVYAAWLSSDGLRIAPSGNRLFFPWLQQSVDGRMFATKRPI